MPSIPSPIPTPATLTRSTLQSLLALYASALAHLAATKGTPKASSEPSLPSLDHLRYTTIPARVRSRRSDAASLHTAAPQHNKEQDDAADPPPGPHGWLEKPELEQLMAWKLARGHARPALPALIRANAPALVRATTGEAFALFAADERDPLPALKVLARLRGVGPATASLLLAVAWPAVVPFFADEVLGWLRWGEAGDKGMGEGKGKLRYDWKEYREVWEGVGRVREGLGKGAGAEEVERGAWVVEMLKGGVVEGAVFGALRGGGIAEGAGARSADGKDEEASVGQAVVEGDAGEAEEVENGRGKRKAEVEIDDVEKPAKVSRRRRTETSKARNAVDGSMGRRSSRNKR
ncbi:hypothetical protein MMC18_002075 [Xylographa bjoerkii]|nr:hypothetical protein [Xylographa bjoerkii]